MKSIEDVLKYILVNYKELQRKGFKGSELTPLFNKDIPEIFTNELNLSKNYIVKAGCGHGRVAAIPWICILDTDITNKVLEGYYIAIIFTKDMSGFYLTLNQGFKWFEKKFGTTKGLEAAYQISIKINDILNTPLDRKINLVSDTDLAKGYEATTICSKYYNINTIESISINNDIIMFINLLKDLRKIIKPNYEIFNDTMTSGYIDNNNILFTLKRFGEKATLIYDNGKYILQKGSYIYPKSDEFLKYNDNYYKISQEYYKYLDSGRLLTRDVEFFSPSAAGNFANGRSTNGVTDWIDANGRQLSEYMKTEIKDSKNTIEKFKAFYLTNKEEKEESENHDWLVNANEYIKQFQFEYPIERILDLRLDEYCLGIENSSETLSYHLEFGKYKKVGPSIGGGSVRKHGVYFSTSENKYKGADGVIDDIDTYWPEFKQQLYDYIKMYESDVESFNTNDKFPLLKGMSLILTKLLNLYYPYKFINIASKQKLNEAFKVFDYKTDTSIPAEQLSYILNKNIRNDLNMYNEDNPELLGDAIWNYLILLNEDKSVKQDVHYWLYTPGLSGCMWEEYDSKGIMAIENDGLGDLLMFSSKEEIKEELDILLNNEMTNSLKNKVLEKWEFSREINQGDIIFAKRGDSTMLGRGVVMSDYIYDEDKNLSYREVNWTNKEEWSHYEKFGNGVVRKTLTDITKYPGYPEKIEKFFKQEIIIDTYDRESFLDEVFVTPEKYVTMVNTLLRKKNIILQGSPGVGKTFCAKKLMQSIIGRKEESRIYTVQFHQSYSYEDFIQGFRPNDDGKFELKNGLFYEIVKQACNEYETNKENAEKYCIIIDEINRGNLSKIFGELMMLIESDKRSKKWAINLTYSDETFYIPENLYIIGTMNTADRSLTMVDYALRRRFAFIDLDPAFGNNKMEEYLINKENIDEGLTYKIMSNYSKLNQYITEKLGKGFQIGHSYFINQFTDSSDFIETYEEIVDYEIKPLIEEYFFDDETRIKEALELITLKEQ